MERVIAFPQKKEQTLIANTFSTLVQTAIFRLDEQHVVVALQTPTFHTAQTVHLQLLCGEAVTTTHIYYVHRYFDTHFPHVTFVFRAQTSEAVLHEHIMVCCVAQPN